MMTEFSSHVSVHTHTRMHTHTHIHCTHAHVCTHTYTLYTRTHVCTHTHIIIHTLLPLYLQTYAHAHTHTGAAARETNATGRVVTIIVYNGNRVVNTMWECNPQLSIQGDGETMYKRIANNTTTPTVTTLRYYFVKISV